MTLEEYRGRFAQIELGVTLIVNAKPAELAEALDRAETLGPILDPTLYQAAADGAEQAKTLLRAAAALDAALRDYVTTKRSGS